MFLRNRIKEKRLERGMTQTELGDLLNVTKVTVSCYERGTRNPNLEMLSDLANIFGVSTDFFFGRDIPLVMEGTDEYGYISKNENIFLKELRKDNDFYSHILEDPKRTVELMKKKLK